jgi:hypothetical protein
LNSLNESEPDRPTHLLSNLQEPRFSSREATLHEGLDLASTLNSIPSPDRKIAETFERLQGIGSHQNPTVDLCNQHRTQVFEWIAEQGGLSDDLRELASQQLGLSPSTITEYYSKFKNQRLKPLVKDPYKVIHHPRIARPLQDAENDEFSDSEDFIHDPDRISSNGTSLDISNRFRTKIFEILERSGGLKNHEAAEAASIATGYKQSTLKSLFRQGNQRPPLKRKLYSFTEDDPKLLAAQLNKRIRYLKRRCLPSQKT